MILLLLALTVLPSVWAQLNPVVIVPGFSAAYILAKFDNAPFPEYCKNHTATWTLIWPETKTLDPYQEECWVRALSYQYDKDLKEFRNFPGVETKTVDFGEFWGMSGALAWSLPWEKAGYRAHKTLFAAPMDWRRPSISLTDYFVDLQELIEHASDANGGLKVNLVADSLGPQVTLSFLHRMNQAWKDKFINWFVAISPVWSGTPTTVLAAVSGIPFNNNLKLVRDLASAVDSLFWLFPRAGDNANSWNSSEPIIQTPSKTYTAFDFDQLLIDLGYPQRTESRQIIAGDADLAQFDAPTVDTIVVYGYGIGTPGLFKYTADFDGNTTVIPQILGVVNVTETGDTLVPMRSSRRGEGWSAAQLAANKSLLHRAYLGDDHGICGFKGLCFTDVIALLQKHVVPPMRSPYDKNQ